MKKERIKEIFKEQLFYYNKLAALSKLQAPKRNSTNLKRSARAFIYAIHMRNLEVEKRIVIAAPINKEL